MHTQIVVISTEILLDFHAFISLVFIIDSSTCPCSFLSTLCCLRIVVDTFPNEVTQDTEEKRHADLNYKDHNNGLIS